MEIYTDGSHSVKPRMSGIGAIIIANGQQHIIGRYTTKCSDNNVAEIVAIAYALKYINDYDIDKKSNDRHIIIYTDSSNALHKIKYHTPGKDEFEQDALDYIQDFLIRTQKKVTMFHIKGHVHDGTKLSFYNNLADEIAGEYRHRGLDKLQARLRKIKKYNEY